MPICLACYGPRVAALLESATELRLSHGPPERHRPEEVLPLPAPVGELGLPRLLEFLRAKEAGLLLCGGLTCCEREFLAGRGLTVEPWVGGTAEEVARAWWSGRIDAQRMPGCGGQRRRRGRGRHSATCDKESEAMSSDIIAITSEGPALSDMVDPRFGRAAGFVVLNLVTSQASYIDNGGSQAMAQGAGIQAAENVARAGAGTVLSGFVGPKAFQALQAAGIAVIQDVEGMTVAQAVEKYRRGELAAAATPNAPAGGHKDGGHRGGGRA